jgi:hypothetical protein
MTKSNVTVVPVVSSNSGGLVYYCAGRHCAISDDCHRYTSGIKQQNNPVYDEYDTLMLSEGNCRFFVNVKEANRVGE